MRSGQCIVDRGDSSSKSNKVTIQLRHIKRETNLSDGSQTTSLIFKADSYSCNEPAMSSFICFTSPNRTYTSDRSLFLSEFGCFSNMERATYNKKIGIIGLS